MAAITKVFSPNAPKWALDLGLFLLRAGTGLLLMPHGLKKLESFGDKSAEFYNFLHLGGQFSMVLTIFAELVCSVLLVLGIGTRFVLVPLIITMIVIVFVINGQKPIGDQESGLLYLVPFVVLLFTGPGRISLDYLIFSRKPVIKTL